MQKRKNILQCQYTPKIPASILSIHVWTVSACVVCFNYMVVSWGIIHVHVRCSTISPYYTPLCNCTRSVSANAFTHYDANCKVRRVYREISIIRTAFTANEFVTSRYASYILHTADQVVWCVWSSNLWG